MAATTPIPPAQAPVAPAVLQDERFLLLGTLGCGGMARVYHAFDRLEQRTVALKVQSDEMRAGPAHPFSTEYEAWTRMRHPNVARVYELAIARSGPLATGTPYLVTELVRGRPIHEALPAGGVAAHTVRQVATQLLRGLEHVHAAGLIHRDLKPANVILAESGSPVPEIKLIDFGLAAKSGLREEPGTISGSLPYVAPEALLGLPLDERSDLYALGILLYRLSTGKMPTEGRTAEEIVRWHLGGAPADPRDLRPGFPARLARFVRRLTSRSPESRPADARKALELLGTDSGENQPRPHPVAGRAERAALRLALDAARLGGLRTFRLPRGGSRSTALLREVRVWSQIHGLVFCDLSLGDRREPWPLVRLALRLLLGQQSRAAELMARFGLRRWLPMTTLGGHPVLDGPGWRSEQGATLSPEDRRAGAIALRRFVFECTRRRTLVLRERGTAPRGSLTRMLTDELRRAVARGARPEAERGGLLLLVGE